jgi:hypothetical protein
MEKATIIGIDLVKFVFLVQAAAKGRPSGIAQEGVAGTVARLPGGSRATARGLATWPQPSSAAAQERMALQGSSPPRDGEAP